MPQIVPSSISPRVPAARFSRRQMHLPISPPASLRAAISTSFFAAVKTPASRFSQKSRAGFRAKAVGRGESKPRRPSPRPVREKAACRNFEPLAQLIVELNQQRQHAVIFVAGLGHEPAGDFELQRCDHPFRPFGRLRQFHENRRGDGVGQIGHELPIVPIARLVVSKIPKRRRGAKQISEGRALRVPDLLRWQSLGLVELAPPKRMEIVRAEIPPAAHPFSMARTSPAFCRSNSVSGPSPGPISRTLSVFFSSAASTMRRS